MSSAEAENAVNTPLMQDYNNQERSDRPRIINEECAVLTYTGTLTAKTWRTYLQKNWVHFKAGLTEVKLLIICGVHGGSDGSIGDDAHNVEDCKSQLVSLLTSYIPTVQCPTTFITHRHTLCEGY